MGSEYPSRMKEKQLSVKQELNRERGGKAWSPGRVDYEAPQSAYWGGVGFNTNTLFILDSRMQPFFTYKSYF